MRGVVVTAAAVRYGEGMRFVGHARSALGMAFCAALAACGGAKSNDDGWEEVVPEPVATSVTEEEPAVPDHCPFMLDGVRQAQVGVRYVVEGLSSASVLVVPLADGNPSEISYTYEVRDESGREAGTTTYVCDNVGLGLAATGTEARHLAFEPPLPALSAEPTDGRTTGVATLSTGGDAVVMPYTFEFAITAGTSAGPMEGEPGRRVSARSVLVLGGTDAETRIESESLWLISPSVLGIMERRQTTTGPDGVSEQRVERAGSLRR